MAGEGVAVTSARFRLEVPESTWIAELSGQYPDARFRLLAGLSTDRGAIELGEVVAEEVDSIVAAVRRHPDVHNYEPLFVEDRRGLARYETADASLYTFLRDSAVPPAFPIEVRDGRVEFEVTASRERLRQFTRTLASGDLEYEVLRVAETSAPGDLLTERQRDVLQAAVARGYYAIPRDCTLAELSDHLGIDKSTASGILRRAEEQIVTWFLAATRSGLDDVG